MFPYTEKYKESESDIQNNDVLYKTKNAKTLSKCWRILENHKNPNLYFVICINAIIDIL